MLKKYIRFHQKKTNLNYCVTFYYIEVARKSKNSKAKQFSTIKNSRKRPSEAI